MNITTATTQNGAARVDFWGNFHKTKSVASNGRQYADSFAESAATSQTSALARTQGRGSSRSNKKSKSAPRPKVVASKSKRLEFQATTSAWTPCHANRAAAQKPT